MRFSPTTIEGVTLIEFEPAEDTRGFFARAFCEEQADRAGIALRARQINLSHNRNAFTLRGMHYQAAPHTETKIIQCVRGRAYDVALDLRLESASYRRWIGFELSSDRPRSLFIPEGCAHGFLTLEADTDLLYLMGTAYVAEAACGVRWNDPAFAIQWPAEPRVISERDASFPDYERS
jgi:dTDP-4-dehydrorhamnose 3,5-epimerase